MQQKQFWFRKIVADVVLPAAVLAWLLGWTFAILVGMIAITAYAAMALYIHIQARRQVIASVRTPGPEGSTGAASPSA